MFELLVGYDEVSGSLLGFEEYSVVWDPVGYNDSSVFAFSLWSDELSKNLVGFEGPSIFEDLVGYEDSSGPGYEGPSESED